MKISRQHILYSLLSIILLVCIIIYYVFFYITPVDWTERYSERNDQPYDTQVIYKLLESISPDNEIVPINKPLRKFFSDNQQKGHANYVFVGPGQYLLQEDADSLLAFVSHGNDAFISSPFMPYEITKHLYSYSQEDTTASNSLDSLTATTDSLQTDTFALEGDTVFEAQETTDTLSADTSYTAYTDAGTVDLFNQYNDTIISFNFAHPDLKYPAPYQIPFLYDFKPAAYNWAYIADSVLLDSNRTIAILGYFNENKAAFVRYKIGNGYLYYHSLPVTLGNYYLIQPEGISYANRLFGHLHNGKVYWDNYHESYNSSNNEGSVKGFYLKEGPLRYVLSQPSLRWAWYICLGMVLLYLFFYLKRKQRPIPLIVPNTNSSIEYVETIGHLYHNQADHRVIADLKFRNFGLYVQERYGISRSLGRDEYIEKFSKISGVPANKISYIFVKHDQFVRHSTLSQSDSELLEFHKAIEYFYQTCK